MAKIDEAELGADFNYIIRLADSDVDGLSRIGMGLTSVKGVGVRTALAICKIAGVDKDPRMSRKKLEMRSTRIQPKFQSGC